MRRATSKFVYAAREKHIELSNTHDLARLDLVQLDSLPNRPTDQQHASRLAGMGDARTAWSRIAPAGASTREAGDGAMAGKSYAA